MHPTPFKAWPGFWIMDLKGDMLYDLKVIKNNP